MKLAVYIVAGLGCGLIAFVVLIHLADALFTSYITRQTTKWP